MLFTRRRRGIGLTGILIILAVLYFTGVISWIWERALGFEQECFRMAGQMGVSFASPVCEGVGAVVETVDHLTSDLPGTLQNAYESVGRVFSGSGEVQSVIGEIQIPAVLRRMGSNNADLDAFVKYGPRSAATTDSLQEQIRSAMDNFMIGQRYLDTSYYSPDKALPWLQRGASVPGYGLLSQISLGDVYRNGQGVPANPEAAISYYSQASQSIAMLQYSKAPEAQAMLKSLPGTPTEVQKKLRATIQQLQFQSATAKAAAEAAAEKAKAGK